MALMASGWRSQSLAESDARGSTSGKEVQGLMRLVVVSMSESLTLVSRD